MLQKTEIGRQAEKSSVKFLTCGGNKTLLKILSVAGDKTEHGTIETDEIG